MIAWQRMRVIVLTLVAALLLGPGVSRGVAQSESPERPREPTLETLLDRFPIGTEPVSTTSGAQRGANIGTTLPEPGDPGAGTTFWILLAGAGAIVLLIASGATAFQWQRVRGSERFSLSTSSLALFHEALAESSERSSRVVELPKGLKSRHSQSSVAEHDQQGQVTGAGASDSVSVDERDYEGFGKRVVGILEAAEIAAAQIRAEAVDAAGQTRADGVDAAAGIRKAAEDEAQLYLTRAEQEAATVRSDAETAAQEALRAAEADSAARIQEAETQVQTMVADAEARVLSIHDEAAEKARQIHLAAREREDVLRAQVAPLEENLRRALEAFRGISGQLEELLADLPGSTLADSSLVDDLAESARTTEARVESGASR